MVSDKGTSRHGAACKGVPLGVLVVLACALFGITATAASADVDDSIQPEAVDEINGALVP